MEKFAHLKILLFIHGETQCLAKNYDCNECPLFKICNRAQKESQEEIAYSQKKKETKISKENKESQKAYEQLGKKEINPLSEKNKSIQKKDKKKKIS